MGREPSTRVAQMMSLRPWVRAVLQAALVVAAILAAVLGGLWAAARL